MPKFQCQVCSTDFEIPQAALDKYPGWKPKYCKAHSPKKAAASETNQSSKSAKKSSYRGNSKEELLSLDEVLQKYSEGPQSGIFTDGSARPNPGRGGWGYVYVVGGKIISQKHGCEDDTTNNRMELTALINAYKSLPNSEKIDIYTDSNLCVNTINIWAKNWQKNGWRRKDGDIANLDLVKEVYELAQSHPNAKLQWIEAHNGWLWNEYADSLSTAWLRETI